MMDKIKEGTIIYSVLIGSRAYGTHSETSDFDYKHIYIQSVESTMIEGYKPQININKDEVAFEIKRFTELLILANPTALEMLFVNEEHILKKLEIFNDFYDNRKLFLTKRCEHSFGGYASSQIKKAKGTNKKMNWPKVQRKDVIDFCYVLLDKGKSMPLTKWIKKQDIKLDVDNFGLVKTPHVRDCFGVFVHETFRGLSHESGNDIRLSSIPKELLHTFLTNISFNKDAYSQHCKDYKEYKTWLKERNEDRYVDVKGHQQMIDGKNMLHTVRLLKMAVEIGETSNMLVMRPDADYLKSIRKGNMSLEQLINYCKIQIAKLKAIYLESNLPLNNDLLLEKLLLNIRNKQLSN